MIKMSQRKSFTGSYLLLFILLCCFIIPGVIYYVIARRRIGGTQQIIQQNVTVQQVSHYPTQKGISKTCPQCGTNTKGNFCDNCGMRLQ